ncbi:MAG: hypothetical protein KY432_06980 [Acidobacteria bacterium]|nr:hypothetical protein [Acidobacteriota bacterium]
MAQQYTPLRFLYIFPHQTYQSVIEEAKPLERVGDTVAFELFGESFDQPLSSLAESLPE